MITSRQGLYLIKKFESCRLKAYQDSKGIWTIGWGSIIIDGRPVRKGDSIIQEKADVMLSEEIKGKEQELDKLLPTPLLQHQYDSLMSFGYNLGMHALASSTLLKKIIVDPLDHTIRDEFIKWRNKGSSFEKGLLRRRLAEAYLYETGLIKLDWDKEIKEII